MRRSAWLLLGCIAISLVWLQHERQSAGALEQARSADRPSEPVLDSASRDSTQMHSGGHKTPGQAAALGSAASPEPEVAAQFSTSEDLQQLIAPLEQRALSGDADASYYMARIFDECIKGRMLLELDGESFSGQVRLATLRSSQKRQWMAQSIERRRQRCEAFADYSEEEGAALINEWLERADEQGSLAAAAALATETLAELWLHPGLASSGEELQSVHEQLTQLGIEALETRNADAVMELSSVFDVANVSDNEWLNSFTAVHNPAQLWELLACDLGYPCHNNANIVQGTCAYYGICGYPSLEAAYQSEIYPPAAWAEMNELRSAIHRAIAAGEVGAGVHLPSS